MSVTKLVIPRHLWGKNRLRNSDGTMCCLGHLSVACGVDSSLLDMAYGQPRASWVNVPTWAKYGGTNAAAISINDNDMSSDIREAKLIELFKEKGIALSFTGEYAPAHPDHLNRHVKS